MCALWLSGNASSCSFATAVAIYSCVYSVHGEVIGLEGLFT